MPNETQDLVFNLKANTSNAEQGMARVGKLTDDLKITTEKTSGAMREFGNQLKQARDLSDVAGMATKALGQVLGASLGGTVVLVAGKALIDAFNSVQKAVKETEERVKDTFKEINKTGIARSFEESAAQANKLAEASDAVKKKIEEIEANPLQKFIAGITGAKDKMEELANSTQKAATERIKLGVERAIEDEQFERGLSEKEKSLNNLFKSYQGKADQIATSMLAAGAKPEEIKTIVDQIYNAHTQARDKMLADYALKEYAVEEKNARDSSDLKRDLAMSEFQLEQDSKNRAREIERARLNEDTAARLKALDEEAKKKEETAKKMEEHQNRLTELAKQRLLMEESLKKAEESQLSKQAEMAKVSGRGGGTMRGAGQRETSYEVGLKAQGERAYRGQLQKEIDAYDRAISEGLKEQGKTFDKYAVQREKSDIVKREAQQKAQKQFEDPYKKQIQGLKESLKESKDLAEIAKAPVAPAGPLTTAGPAKEKTNVLEQIRDLLQKNLTDLAAYAHAT